jgi:hypothetical protein
VVAVRGRNPTGKQLLASQVLAHLPRPRYSPASPERAAAGLSLVVAAGPYTCADNLSYEPLEQLLAACSASKPQVGRAAGGQPGAPCKGCRCAAGAVWQGCCRAAGAWRR